MQKTYAIWALCWLILLLLALFYMAYEANAAIPRYRLIFATYTWHDTDNLNLIRPMCWNDTEGWCDVGDSAIRRIAYVIDFESDKHGLIMRNDLGCFVWWLRPEYGADNNPHIESPYWIECL